MDKPKEVLTWSRYQRDHEKLYNITASRVVNPDYANGRRIEKIIPHSVGLTIILQPEDY